MPFNTDLPSENTDPWYSGIVSAWGALTSFVNGLESSLANKVNSSTFTSALAGKVDAGSLAGVATSGAYGDLTGTPTLGTAADQDVVVGLETPGVPHYVVIPSGGTVPVGLSPYALVIELDD